MRAAVYERYGGPISIRDVAAPRAGPGEVLVRVHAAALNSWDWDQFAGTVLGRLGGPFRPRNRILGADVAGTVEAVGDGVTAFSVGDAVAGDLSEAGWATLAEFVSAPAEALARIPEGVSFEQAAAIPQAGGLALQGLRQRRAVRPGETVLVNGGGGGVGTFAIQLAKAMGAEVTAVDHGGKLETMRAAGADRGLDYVHEDFTREGRRYDRILDPVAHRRLAVYRQCLAPDGTLVVIGGNIPALLQLGLFGRLGAKPGGQDIGLLLYRVSADDTAELLGMCAAGTIRPVIDRVFPLAGTEEALRRIGEGKVLGKAVVAVAA